MVDTGHKMVRAVHGGLDLAELRRLGLDPRAVLDFSSSINPLGAPPGVMNAIADVNIAAYPDSDCLELREALGGSLNLEPDRILVGNGSTELIHLLATAFLSKGDGAVIFGPAFGEYLAACAAQGVEPVELVANEADDFRWDIAEACQSIRELRPGMVFLCNPNNPTGLYLDEDKVRRIAAAASASGVLVLDEAYVSFVDGAWDSRPLLEISNVVLLRSMTKDYALTGLRLGYMLSSPEVIAGVKARQYSWSVNAAAQAAGVMCLGRQDHLEQGREAVRIGKAYLVDALVSMGLKCRVGAANFLLASVGDATTIRLRLLKEHGICVRDCASFGLPGYIRIGVRKMDDCRRLVAALDKALSDG
ncbi:MAG: histidinol-phosphate aminotransferase family protein [Chloroflexi bacterium]|nr:histidinol-phosphate aminotransferase family protein [Chloroflexota bacterium]